jgi:hypothetical protein
MKGRDPLMVIAIGVGKKGRGKDMEEMDDMEDRMEDDSEEMMGGGMTRYKKGGAMYAQGGSLKMVDKGGEKVPFFAADGKGKMMGGGMTYAEGGSTGRGSRDGCAIKGKTKGRMV